MFADPGSDPFTSVASEMFKKAPPLVSPQERSTVKAICYGILYGMGVQALAARLDCDVHTATAWRNCFLDRYPQVLSHQPSSAVRVLRSHSGEVSLCTYLAVSHTERLARSSCLRVGADPTVADTAH